MIIVAGWIRVAPHERADYLDGCRSVVEAARRAPGCVDFTITADLLDDGRIDVFEQWESVDAVEAFRGSGPSGDQQAQVLDAQVVQHTVAESTSLT